MQAGGRIDPVGREEQGREQQGPFGTSVGDAIDLFTDRVDAPSVEGLEEAGVLAERAGEVAVASGQAVQVVELPGDIAAARIIGAVRLDEGDGQDLRVAGEVVGGDVKSRPLEALRDTRGASEQVGDRPCAGAVAHGLGERDDARHEGALGAEILDQPTARAMPSW